MLRQYIYALISAGADVNDVDGVIHDITHSAMSSVSHCIFCPRTVGGLCTNGDYQVG